MKHRFLHAMILPLLAATPPLCSAAALDTAKPPQGYVLLEGAQARLALTGNLFRVAVRAITRGDGSKATVFRDIDYPVRAAEAPPTIDAPTDPSDVHPTKPDGESDDDDDASREPEMKPAPHYSAWVMLGPEYEDPPPPNASPSANRLRRPGPASVVYEFDGYAESGGTDDEVLRLELDFSGTHVIVRSGSWSMEAEAGDMEPSDDADYDFTCEQGAYGLAFGRIDTKDLHTGVPDEITVTLVRKTNSRENVEAEPDEHPRENGGTGTHTLKRKPAAPAT